MPQSLHLYPSEPEGINVEVRIAEADSSLAFISIFCRDLASNIYDLKELPVVIALAIHP